MPQALIAVGSFLCGVLWMDLMFDVQVWGVGGSLPPAVLDDVAGYYRRVTTDAAPMGNVIGLAMMLAVLGAVVQLARSGLPLWLRAGALAAAALSALIALTVVVPAAVRLGAGAETPEAGTALARTILTGHLWCLALMLAFVVLQLLAVQRLRTGEGAVGAGNGRHPR